MALIVNKEKKMRLKFQKKGFTLVEVMIVVAIIGLLAAIAIPNLLRARVNANDGSVRGDLRAVSTALESYRAAQSPPAYPTGIGSLTGATPPYLDSSWADTSTKHGHTLDYSTSTAGYTVTAGSQTGSSASDFCIDHTGVLRTASTTANSTCSGTAVS